VDAISSSWDEVATEKLSFMQQGGFCCLQIGRKAGLGNRQSTRRLAGKQD
jgi:hypothetical protein